MKIGQPSDTPVSASSTASSLAPKSAQSAAASASTASTGAEKPAGVAVTVSNLARSLGGASRSQPADVDVKKVETVRMAIQKGTYTVNAEAIADKLLGNAQEMLDRTRS
jgi:negative regulator of flagellin synthesis FlgM